MITNLEKKELGPMTRDLRDHRKRKGLCMFCGTHPHKEGQKCPNYDRLRLASVKTTPVRGTNKPKRGSGKGRKSESQAKNFVVKESDSSTSPEGEGSSTKEEVQQIEVKRTARSRSLSQTSQRRK